MQLINKYSLIKNLQEQGYSAEQVRRESWYSKDPEKEHLETFLKILYPDRDMCHDAQTRIRLANKVGEIHKLLKELECEFKDAFNQHVTCTNINQHTNQIELSLIKVRDAIDATRKNPTQS